MSEEPQEELINAYWVLSEGRIMKLQKLRGEWRCQNLNGRWVRCLIHQSDWGTKAFKNYWHAYKEALKQRKNHK